MSHPGHAGRLGAVVPGPASTSLYSHRHPRPECLSRVLGFEDPQERAHVVIVPPHLCGGCSSCRTACYAGSFCSSPTTWWILGGWHGVSIVHRGLLVHIISHRPWVFIANLLLGWVARSASNSTDVSEDKFSNAMRHLTHPSEKLRPFSNSRSDSLGTQKEKSIF